MRPSERQMNRFFKKLRKVRVTTEYKSIWFDEDNKYDKDYDDGESREMDDSNILKFKDSYK